jgi:hypothetical protein
MPAQVKDDNGCDRKQRIEHVSGRASPLLIQGLVRAERDHPPVLIRLDICELLQCIGQARRRERRNIRDQRRATAHEEVIMGLDKARYDSPAFEVEEPLITRDRISDFRLRADRDDPVAANGHGLCRRSEIVDGHDVRVDNQRDFVCGVRTLRRWCRTCGEDRQR